MASFPGRLPVLIRFSEEAARQDCWGRLEKLSGTDALLSTRARLARGDRVLLDFELGPGSFEGVPGEVHEVEFDLDRYCSAEIRFTDEVCKRRLATALLDLLSR